MKSRVFRLIGPKTSLDSRQKIFSDAALMQIIVPLFFEQLLTMMVGIADTFMISYAGDAAVSGVSLVNCSSPSLSTSLPPWPPAAR